MPIKKARTELGRGFSREGMESVEDKWVSGRGGMEFGREGGVDEVNEEGVGKEGNISVVYVGRGNVIRAVREVFSWNMSELEVGF